TVSIRSPGLSELAPEGLTVVYYLPENGDPQRVESESTVDGVVFTAGHFSVYAVALDTEGLELLYGDVAEHADGDNWKALSASGWFSRYSGCTYTANSSAAARLPVAARIMSARTMALSDAKPSDVQVEESGGTNTSTDGTVSVSKTISGTDLENVFDITLQVQTSVEIDEIKKEPDMAVVIVMDISNTMNSNFGGVTRYAAAMTAAEDFLDQFAANNTLGISKVGYVAFNTDAHQIFGLQSCSTQAQADALPKNKEEILPREQLRTRAAEVLRFDALYRADLTLLLERVRVSEGRGVEFVFRFRRPEAGKNADA
ncbi:MAG: hypothetical protein ACI4PV_07385, partial [Butyricicoccus sp.]